MDLQKRWDLNLRDEIKQQNLRIIRNTKYK